VLGFAEGVIVRCSWLCCTWTKVSQVAEGIAAKGAGMAVWSRRLVVAAAVLALVTVVGVGCRG
jgi:hypothetical protein